MNFTNFLTFQTLNNMQVKDIMYTDVACLKPSTTFLEAAELFLKHKISGAPVVDDSGKIIGVLSEKDLFRAMYPSFKSFYSNPTPYVNHEDELEDSAKDAAKKIVEEIMVKRVITATPETNILKIGGMMIATGIHRVPVVENGKVIGMVSRGTIYRAILQATFPKLRD